VINRYLVRVERGWLTVLDFKKSGLVVDSTTGGEAFIGDVDEEDEDDDEEEETQGVAQEGPAIRRRRRDDMEPESQFTNPPSSFDFSFFQNRLEDIWNGMTGMRTDLGHVIDQTRTVSSQVHRVSYIQEYNQPHINRWIEQERQAPPQGLEYRPFTPPPIFKPRQTTYGFFWPPDAATIGGFQPHYTTMGGGTEPQIGTYTGGAAASSSGVGPSSSAGGDIYAGHAYDFYGAGFFSDPFARPSEGDGTRSIFSDDDAMQQ
jgi:hypothetical protein